MPSSRGISREAEPPIENEMAPGMGVDGVAKERPFALSAEEVCAAFEVDPQYGLSSKEASRRLQAHGANKLRLRLRKREGSWTILARRLTSLMVALLTAARKAGIERALLEERRQRSEEESSDPRVRMMATCHESDGGTFVAAKGAPEAVLDVPSKLATKRGECDLTAELREERLSRIEEMAGSRLRVLAIACKQTGAEPREYYKDLILAGLVGFFDPARPDIQSAIEECKRAGVKTVMVTGDQPATARSVARSIRLVQDDVAPVLTGKQLQAADPEVREDIGAVAIRGRVDTEQKLDVVSLLRETLALQVPDARDWIMILGRSAVPAALVVLRKRYMYGYSGAAPMERSAGTKPEPPAERASRWWAGTAKKRRQRRRKHATS